MEVPDGISGVEGMVRRLLKCPYGLKQSPRMWNKTIDKVLGEIGFVRLQSDNGVYVYGMGDDRVFIALYVDDLLMVWKSRKVLDLVKEKLHEKCGMADSKEVRTPFERGSILEVEGGPQSVEERATMVGVPYRSLVGILMYLAVCTRPDIAMGVSTLSRFLPGSGDGTLGGCQEAAPIC